jgi:hypothetical protein
MMSLLCQPLLLLIACAVVSYDSLFSPSDNKSPHSVLAVVCVRCHDKALQVALGERRLRRVEVGRMIDLLVSLRNGSCAC